MTGPKHLWSGDWERDSPEPAAPLRPHRPLTPPPPDPPARDSAAERRASLRRMAPLVIILAAVALAAGAVIAVATDQNTPSHRQPPAQPTTPSAFSAPPTMTLPTPQTLPSAAPPTTTSSGPSGPTRRILWLGMQIVNAPGGGAVIETVKLGSEGDQVGLSPGDTITSLNGHQISDPSQIRSAIAGLQPGAETMIAVDRGSSQYATTIFLGAPPRAEP